MLVIVVHENMKLGDNILNNERLSLVNKISDKILANCSGGLILIRAVNTRKDNLKNLNFFKKSM